jgi:microcystin-dependent protein
MAIVTVVIADPIFLQNKTYGAIDDRKVLQDLIMPGVAGSGDFAVTFSSGRTLSVAAGIAFVKGLNVSDQGAYRVRTSGSTSITGNNGDATNPRIDQVVIRVMDTTHDSSGSTEARVEIHEGTPTAGATLANRSGAANLTALSAKSVILLADLLVPAGATSYTGGNLGDKRTLASIALSAPLGVGSVSNAALAAGAVTDTKITGPIAVTKLAAGSANQLLTTIGGVPTWTTPGVASDPTPPGSIHEYGGDTAPAGYLLCDGAAVSRSTYSALFAIIGTKFGTGDGSTTFNLPNLKGKMSVMRDASITAFDTIGESGGLRQITLTTAQMPNHVHSDPSHTHSAGPNLFIGMKQEAAAGTAKWVIDNAGSPSAVLGTTSSGGGGSTGAAGSGSAIDIMNPYVVVNKIIKT